MGTFMHENESDELKSESSDSIVEEYDNKMTVIEKSFINRRRYKSMIEQEDTLNRERLQLMKFTLCQFMLKFAKQSQIERENNRLKKEYQQRKMLIQGITMRMKQCLFNLTINQRQPEKDRKTFTQIVYSDETVFTNKMQVALRSLLLKRMQTSTGPKQQKGGIYHLHIIEELQKIIQTITGIFMDKQTSDYVNEYKCLLWEIMKQLRTQQNAWGHRRVELEGVHFIH